MSLLASSITHGYVEDMWDILDKTIGEILLAQEYCKREATDYSVVLRGLNQKELCW